MLAAARAAELREAARKEKEERAKKGQLSFNQKVSGHSSVHLNYTFLSANRHNKCACCCWC